MCKFTHERKLRTKDRWKWMEKVVGPLKENISRRSNEAKTLLQSSK